MSQEGAGHAVLSAYVEIVFDNADNRLPVRIVSTPEDLSSFETDEQNRCDLNITLAAVFRISRHPAMALPRHVISSTLCLVSTGFALG